METYTEHNPESVTQPAVQDDIAKVALADYWGVDEVHKHYLPDGVQFFEYVPMNEGKRARYQRATASSMEFVKSSGNTRMQIDPGKERRVLLTTCVTGWNMFRDGKQIAFSSHMFERWLDNAPVHLIDELEKAVRSVNAWMTSAMSVEEIDNEIERLQESREKAVLREAEEAEFPNK